MSAFEYPATTSRGRTREHEVLDRLLLDVRAGRSRALVLRGAAGVGKSALLAYLASRAPRDRIVHTAGMRTESVTPYSALQQVCGPLLDHLDQLLPSQQGALIRVLKQGGAGGPGGAEPPGRLLLGLAVLGLLSAAADTEPLLCVVDDAQWVDKESVAILAFAARRLDVGSVALVFAVTSGAGADARLMSGLPELRVEGLETKEPNETAHCS